jgi:hypothetical protein
MDDKLIKELIKCKLNVACNIIDHMPSGMSKEIKNMGRVILEGMNESSTQMKEQVASKTKYSNKLNNVPVE